MMKLALSVAALMALVAAMFTPSLVARAQSARFEYMRVAPYGFMQTEGRIAYVRSSYRACLADTAEWTCRDFGRKESSDAALRTALVTLGNEGWELVSAVNADPNLSADSLTFLFKRQRQ